ncbi:MAG TPA: porin family protein [Solimonas sp.]
MKSIKTLLPVAALGALMAMPAVAVAQDARSGGIYLGGGVGYNRIESQDFPNSNDDVEDSRVSYKGILGARLSPNFSLEGQYINFGTAKDGANQVKADGFTAGVVFDLPLTEWFSPYAKAGALFWDADGRFANVRSSDDGTDFTYGVGARFGLSEAVDFRVEYERFELNDTDVDMASANLQFNF